MLASAFHIEREVESGRLRDHAAGSKAPSVTWGRVSQILDLLKLAPAIQEAILVDTWSANKRELRSVARGTF